MLKRIFLVSLVVLLAFAIISAPTMKAQSPDDGSASKGEVLSDSNGDDSVQPLPPASPPANPPDGVSITGATQKPLGDLPELKTPDGQTLPDPESLKARALAFAGSLTPDQKAQIKAILDANPPAYMEGIKGTLGDAAAASTAAQLAPDQLQAMDKAGRQWIENVNAGIKAVLTPEQAAAFDASLLPHPQEWSAKLGVPQPGDITPQSQSDCYNAYYYDYYYTNYYAYYAYIYGYYAYLYESDPYNYYLYALGYDSYNYSYYAYLWNYYAYAYYYNSTYSYYSYYYTVHTVGFAYHDYIFANASYSWTSGSYAYYAYLYGYYTWYYAYYYGSSYAASCL